MFCTSRWQPIVTLPINSYLEYFSNNTVANFKVKLAEQIELTGKWAVALTEIQYPQSWSTIREGNLQTFIYKLEIRVRNNPSPKGTI